MNILLLDVNDTNYHVKRKYGERSLDYAKLLEYIENDILKDSLTFKRAYGRTSFGSEHPAKFITFLRALKFDVNYKHTKENLYQTNNVEMTIDTICNIEQGYTIIIMSKQIDLNVLIEFLKARNVKVIVLSCDIPPMLKNLATACFEIPETILRDKNEQASERPVSTDTGIPVSG